MPRTATRVEENSGPAANAEIHRRTRGAAAAREPREVQARLNALEQEWDIERVLQTNFAILTLATAALGVLVDRRWFRFTGVASAFMLEHALEGWCPPVPVFRAAGVRTRREISLEQTALMEKAAQPA